MTSTATEPQSPRSQTLPLSAATLSIVFFVLFLTTDLSGLTLAASGLSGIVAIVLSILALRRRTGRTLPIVALCIGIVGVILSGGLWVFALLFAGVFSG